MKKKLCCIVMLMIFLLNSSIMILISEAIDVIQTNLEEKVKALAEINLTKYENFDTTTENSDTGSKGVLVQFNLKTGIEFAEGEEYIPIQETTTNINLPWIGNYKPERVEVLTKSTQATNGGKEASYEYHASTGTLSITAENNGYTENVADSRDEYEIICIYNSKCYTKNEENDFKVQLITYEKLNNEQGTTISNKLEEEYTCTDNISGVVSISHRTDKIYDGYITANTLNNENNYDTTYNETLRVMVSNKDIAQKIEVRENSEISLYEETNIDKNQVLDMLGDKGSIDVFDENGNILKTINKDTETDEDGKIKITYENRVQNIIIQLKDLAKEGIFEFQNVRVIEANAQIIENTIPTQVFIKGINTISTEVENDDGEKITETSDLVKYERNGQINTGIKQAVSNIDVKLDKDTLVNNTQNNVIITAVLRTDGPQYSLFKNPTISIEMPAEVENINIGTPEIMYDNQVFNITDSKVSTNNNGNKVINIQLQGSQTSYEQSSVLEGTNIRIPATINVTKQLENKAGIIKCTYSNEMTATTESKETEVMLLNKIVKATQDLTLESGENEEAGTTPEENGSEVKEQVGTISVTKDISAGNGKDIYERQVQKITLTVTNNTNNEIANINLQDEIPNEFIYANAVCNMGFRNGYIEDETITVYEKNIEKLQAKETLTFEYYVRVKQGQEIQEKKVSTRGKATIQATSETFESNVIENTIKESKFQIDMVASSNATGQYKAKSIIDYKIVVKNITNEKLTGVTVTNIMPEGATFNEAFYLQYDEEEQGYFKIYSEEYMNKNYNQNKKMVTWDIGDLDAGKEVGVFVSIILGEIQDDSDIKVITNTAAVKADNTQEYISNKEEIKEINKGTYKVELGTNLESKYLYEGDQFEYIVKITNIGNISIDNAIISDELPKGLSGIEATCSVEDQVGQTVSIKKNIQLPFSLEPGEVFTARILVAADELDEGVEQLEVKNQVEVSSVFINDMTSNEVVNIILKKKDDPTDPSDPTYSTDSDGPNRSN